MIRWLLMNDRYEEAKKVLERIHSQSEDGRNRAHAELSQIQQQVAIDRKLDSSWIHLFRKPSYRKRALLGMATTGIVGCSGVLVINSEVLPALLQNLANIQPKTMVLSFTHSWITTLRNNFSTLLSGSRLA